jgi:hypothetical protein
VSHQRHTAQVERLDDGGDIIGQRIEVIAAPAIESTGSSSPARSGDAANNIRL